MSAWIRSKSRKRTDFNFIKNESVAYETEYSLSTISHESVEPKKKKNSNVTSFKGEQQVKGMVAREWKRF